MDNNAASRNVFRLQQGGNRLCVALHKIVESGDETSKAIAQKALATRAPDDFSLLEEFLEWRKNQ